MRGFSLINLSLAIGILLLVVGVTLPYGIASYRAQGLYQDAANLVYFLESARNRAMVDVEDYAVRREDVELLQYRGPSFSDRNMAEDQVLELSAQVAMEGPVEMYFQAGSGFPRLGSEEYVLKVAGQTYRVHINSLGLVSSELAQ
jgi:hypothetical protein